MITVPYFWGCSGPDDCIEVIETNSKAIEDHSKHTEVDRKVAVGVRAWLDSEGIILQGD